MPEEATLSTERQVWAYVAHRDGKFAGVIMAAYDMPVTPAKAAKLKKEIVTFCGDFIVDGFDVTRVYSREEYNALVDPMPCWLILPGKKAAGRD